MQLIEQSFEDYTNHSAFSRGKLLDFMKSPKHYYMRHVTKEWRPMEQTKAMSFGIIAHGMILEPDKFLPNIVVMPEFERPIKDKKEWLASLEAGKYPVSLDDKIKLDNITYHLKKSELYARFIEGAQCEVTALGNISGVPCKARLDGIKVNMQTSFDLKFTHDASKQAFEESVKKYRYDIQSSFYYLITGIPLTFICVETDTGMVAAYNIVNSTSEVETNVRKFGECERAGRWDGYTERVQFIPC